jgi:hypothetical protein
MRQDEVHADERDCGGDERSHFRHIVPPSACTVADSSGTYLTGQLSFLSPPTYLPFYRRFEHGQSVIALRRPLVCIHRRGRGDLAPYRRSTVASLIGERLLLA